MQVLEPSEYVVYTLIIHKCRISLVFTSTKYGVLRLNKVLLWIQYELVEPMVSIVFDSKWLGVGHHEKAENDFECKGKLQV